MFSKKTFIIVTIFFITATLLTPLFLVSAVDEGSVPPADDGSGSVTPPADPKTVDPVPSDPGGSGSTDPTPAPIVTDPAPPASDPVQPAPSPKETSTPPSTPVFTTGGSTQPTIAPEVSTEDFSAVNPTTQNPDSSKNNLALIIGALALFGGGVFAFKANQKKNDGPCDTIKTKLEQKKTELANVDQKLSLQEIAKQKLAEEIENKKESLKEKAITKVKDKTLEKINSEILKKTIEKAEKGKELYDTLVEKKDEAEKLIEVLKAKRQGLSSEVQKLESEYKVCVAGVTSASVVKKGGIVLPLLGSMPKKIYITGVSGTGKSSIALKLAEKGIPSIDIDEIKDLCKWVHKDTKEITHWYPGVGGQFFESYKYICDKEKLISLMGEHKNETVVVVGLADNQSEFFDLFDTVFLFQCKPDVFLKRITDRTNHDFGKHDSEKKMILGWYKDFEKEVLEKKAIPIDTEAPLEKVLKVVISEIGKL